MTTDLTLYDMSNDLQVLHDAIIEADGEISPEFEKALDGLNLMLAEKVENIGRWVLNINASSDALDAEIERLKKRRDSRKNLQDRLKAYLKLCMEKADKQKLEFTNFNVRMQKNPPSAEITDEAQLPAKYVKIIQMTQIDKKAILDAMKAGDQVPGAVLIADRKHVRIG